MFNLDCFTSYFDPFENNQISEYLIAHLHATLIYIQRDDVVIAKIL